MNNPFRNKQVYTKQTYDRWGKTVKELKGRIKRDRIALDVGPNGKFQNILANAFHIEVMNTNNLDLDIGIWQVSKFWDYIFMFDILEHLMDPFTVLRQARVSLKDGGKLFITVPRRPKFLWNRGHFNEFDEWRFRVFVERAGFKIVYQTSWRMKKSRFGVRPILRYFLERTYFYELRLI